MFLRGIGTHDIYIGILPFVGVQLLVLGLLIAWPGLVLRDTPAPTQDAAAVERELERLTPPARGGAARPAPDAAGEPARHAVRRIPAAELRPWLSVAC